MFPSPGICIPIGACCLMGPFNKGVRSQQQASSALLSPCLLTSPRLPAFSQHPLEVTLQKPWQWNTPGNSKQHTIWMCGAQFCYPKGRPRHAPCCQLHWLFGRSHCWTWWFRKDGKTNVTVHSGRIHTQCQICKTHCGHIKHHSQCFYDGSGSIRDWISPSPPPQSHRKHSDSNSLERQRVVNRVRHMRRPHGQLLQVINKW